MNTFAVCVLTCYLNGICFSDSQKLYVENKEHIIGIDPIGQVYKISKTGGTLIGYPRKQKFRALAVSPADKPVCTDIYPY